MADLRCGECGMRVQPPSAYHPFLYCELFKLGHPDPEGYLRSYGFEPVNTVNDAADAASSEVSDG